MPKHELFSVYAGEPVLVTGHSGFKGGWLAAWLGQLGAKVTGLSLPPEQGPDNLFERARIGERCHDNRWVDIRDEAAVAAAVREVRPTVVFHLAAQPLVHRGYREPLLTFATNIMGAANVLHAALTCESVKAVVFVTSDKVYDNNEWVWAYRENDRLGGLDPYSASKGAAELVARSFMDVMQKPGSGYRLATARGGNVVGGGDWSENRIVPDVVRALRSGDPLVLRHPGATRPWQHVLELCSGYLTLGARLLAGRSELGQSPAEFKGSYNFGPDRTSEMPVRRLVEAALEHWGRPDHRIEFGQSALHEATYLRVDSSKAQSKLGWKPTLGFDDTIAWTMQWYRRYVDDPSCAPRLVDEQVSAYAGMYGRDSL